LLAWCERATCAAIEDALAAGRTSVGTRVDAEHLAPSPVGATVSVEALLTGVEERTLSFLVEVTDQREEQLARVEVGRVVVDADRFMKRTTRMR
ncbi:MAG: thioesterase family protein, partial [Nocardioidaceae bacterium]